MAEEPPTNPDSGISNEDLVAYLDGELDDETSRRIEGLLVTDPKVRETLQQLERTWDLLEKVEAAKLGPGFTQSTLEVVAVAAAEDLRQRQSDVVRRRRRQWLLGAAGLLAAGLAGFFLVAMLQSDPDGQRLDDLLIARNLDEYRPIDNFEFLGTLRREGLFREEDEPDSPTQFLAGGNGVEPIGPARSQRRQWIENRSPTQRAELFHAFQRLDILDADEQDRLRRLDRQIESDPDGKELREVMRRHYRWLKKLPLYRRAELLEMPSAERITHIREIQRQEEERRLRRPGRQDAENLLEWLNEYAARHEAEVLETLPEARRAEEAKSDPGHRRRLVMSILWVRGAHPDNRENLPVLTESDLADARSRLVPRTRRLLEARTPEDQWRLIASWARYLAHYQGDLHYGDGGLPEISEAELLRFFEYELTPEQRDYLLGLSGDEMQRQLRRRYFRIKPPR